MTDPGARGWARFPADARSRAWAGAALGTARDLLAAPGYDSWWRHGRTWFAGVNLLPNSPDGATRGVPLAGPAIDALGWKGPWDAAQISVVRQGYPGRDPGETEASHRFRRDRDAAHVDGPLPVGATRRRMARETHAFILGLPLTRADPEAGPLVVWEGSHLVIHKEFRTALGDLPPELWSETDLTDIYHAARREIFETCPRVTLHAGPGEALLLHRLVLHGIAPWGPGATADPEGRMIAYFRPPMPIREWLSEDRNGAPPV